MPTPKKPIAPRPEGVDEDIWKKASSLSGKPGVYFGKPIALQTIDIPKGKGRYNEFEEGIIVSSNYGVYASFGEFYRKWKDSGRFPGSLGIPKTDITQLPDDIGKYQEFEKGVLYWSLDTGIHIVSYGDINEKWKALGSEMGSLGYPVEDEQEIRPYHQILGYYQDFQRGSIYKVANYNVIAVISGSIRDKWQGLGGPLSNLGFPSHDVQSISDGIGHAQYFQNGAIYWSPMTGAHVISNYQHKWMTLGGPTGVLGYPTSDELRDNQNVPFQDFQYGSIYDYGQIFAVMSEICAAWLRLDGGQGILGYPTSDEHLSPNGIGRYQSFSGGNIYWTPTTGAYIVSSMLDKYQGLGGPEGILGYPIDNEQLRSRFSFQDFQNGLLTKSSNNISAVVPVVRPYTTIMRLNGLEGSRGGWIKGEKVIQSSSDPRYSGDMFPEVITVAGYQLDKDGSNPRVGESYGIMAEIHFFTGVPSFMMGELPDVFLFKLYAILPPGTTLAPSAEFQYVDLPEEYSGTVPLPSTLPMGSPASVTPLPSILALPCPAKENNEFWPQWKLQRGRVLVVAFPVISASPITGVRHKFAIRVDSLVGATLGIDVPDSIEQGDTVNYSVRYRGFCMGSCQRVVIITNDDRCSVCGQDTIIHAIVPTSVFAPIPLEIQ